MRKLFMLFLSLISIGQMYAHTMWMSLDNSKGTQIQQTVDIFFGDYSDDNPTPTARWFSNLREVMV